MKRITTVPLKALQASEAQTMRYQGMANDMAKLLRDHPCDGSAGLLDKLAVLDSGQEYQASWTEEQPSSPGWYWFMNETMDSPKVFEVADYQFDPESLVRLRVWDRGNSYWLRDWNKNGVWFGPVQAPAAYN